MKSARGEQFRALAELQHEIRLFLQQGEVAAQSQGIGGQQFQVLLAIRDLWLDKPCTIRALSDRLLLKHHSTVELIDRLEAARLVARSRDREDRRQVFVKLQPKGERILNAIIRQRIDDLHRSGRDFVRTLAVLVDRSASTRTATRQRRPFRRVQGETGQRMAAD